jgi:hypothetical protein
MEMFRNILTAILIAGVFLHCYSQDKEEEKVYEYSFTRVMIADPPVAFVLDRELKETSGLVFWRDALWTHNDSGNDPVIYKVDTSSGEIIQRIRIEGADNVDWEDITQDEGFIYVGDFGNNKGNRKDLKLYRINKDRIPATGDAEVRAEVIHFYFSDQETFEEQNRTNNYDCESVVSLGDHLYLFSKNWINQYTRLYKLPKEPGSYSAEYQATFKADGLITGAGLNPQGNRLIFIGYKEFTPFVWLFSDFDGDDFFGGESVRADLPHMKDAQTEGIAFTDSVRVMISCEKLGTEPQVWSANIMEWEKGAQAEAEMSEVSAWEYTILEKKRKFIRYLAVDVSALRGKPFEIWIEKALKDDPVLFHEYKFEKHMGKTYLEMDVYPLEQGKYNCVVGSGSLRDKKEFVLTKF